MDAGLLSVALTMDAKSYPPPHGNASTMANLVAAVMGSKRNALSAGMSKIPGIRRTIPVQLAHAASFEKTKSGKRIYTMSLHDNPDQARDNFSQRAGRSPKGNLGLNGILCVNLFGDLAHFLSNSNPTK